MEQTEIWYRKMGFYNNPFSIKPAAFHSELIGYELDEVFSKIQSGGILFIKGAMGVGKTTILKNVLNRFGGKGKVIYTSCNTSDKDTNYKQLLINTTFLNRLFSTPSKNMILLVDEAQDIKKREANDILRLFKKGNFSSVVFFGTDCHDDKFGPELQSMIKDNTKVLTRLKSEHAVELVRKRIGNLQFMQDAMIRKIYKMSGFNPRKLLENCEDLFNYAASKGDNSITDEHVKAVVKEAKTEKKKSSKPRIMIEDVREIDLTLDTKRKKEKYNYEIRSYEEEMETVKRDVKQEINELD